jgi:hypothetical protein
MKLKCPKLTNRRLRRRFLATELTLLDHPAVAQPFKKIAAFHKEIKFITLFTASGPEPNESNPHPISF